MSKVLIVEDDTELANQLVTWLKFNKFTVEQVSNGNDACQMLELSSYDVIVLDWDIPGKSGLDVCLALRAAGGTTPVVMLTGNAEATDKIKALDAGADDYVTKPFHMGELGARLRALLRRGHVESSSRLRIGLIELDRTTCEVYCNEKKVKLFPKEFALLELFMSNPNRVFSPSELLASAWTMDSSGSEDTVRTFMKTLRRKITPESGECPIKTVYGFGYKFEV